MLVLTINDPKVELYRIHNLGIFCVLRHGKVDPDLLFNTIL